LVGVLRIELGLLCEADSGSAAGDVTTALCSGRCVVDSLDHNRDMSWVVCVRPTRVLLLAEAAVLCFGRCVVDSADHNRDMSWVSHF
jgi:hypothetical protein